MPVNPTLLIRSHREKLNKIKYVMYSLEHIVVVNREYGITERRGDKGK